MEEQWKDVDNFNGDYQVSNLGRLRSKKYGDWRIMTLVQNRKGYFGTGLTKNGKQTRVLIHILVAYYFIGEKPVNKQVDHIDENKANNRADNLQYLTIRENTSKMQLSKPNKTSKYIGVYWNKLKSKWCSRIRHGKKVYFLGYFNNEVEAAEIYSNKLKQINNEDNKDKTN